ncbi:violaceus kinesin [Aspergillus transmontanensis]|uniref:Violaceus kinesin n=1 Tax=Aspergillus transmontanensis TaxID=1034304 RepID=A0A5N6VQE3_9EURO|nr:violaceus kinesin [Aspergillus transmontanensis]
MDSSGHPLHADYMFAWICALPLELAAASAMLDETYPSLPATTVHNAYTLGKVQDHNIVLTCLPAGIYGTTSATAVVSHLQSTFPNLRYGILVGIGGGVPGKRIDIRLGDVVVSKPTGSSGGVIQYDFGKAIKGGHFQSIGMLNQPPMVFLTAISQLEANYIRNKVGPILDKVAEVFSRNPDMENAFSRPSIGDRLFRSTYDHPSSESSCITCDPTEEIKRLPRPSKEPHIHYGTIASGNRVIKDGRERDTIAQEFDTLCFEMEAAGIMNHLPCLVVRGICDYCDSHKNKEWQGYAALVAAIYAKSLLSAIPVDCSQHVKTQKSGIWMIPFNRNPRFMGRDYEIDWLKARVLSRNHARKAAISGLGGIGKTQIAVELAHRIREHYPMRSFFWIPATSLKSVEQAFLNIGEQLGMQNVKAADVKSWVKAYLSSEKAGSWLLIIDNADNPDMWMASKSSSPALKFFLPQSQYGFILFTTRTQQLATKLAGPDIMRVPEIDSVTAITLLRSSLAQDDLFTDETSASMLVCQLGGLPLALIQAASFMNESSISLETYLSLLNREEHTMIELLSEDFEDDYRYPDSKNPVASTWLISFRQIQGSSDLAAKYLSFISCLAPRDIPLSLFPTGQSEIEQHKALGILKSYSFITKQTDSQFISMHRLVHLATRSWLRNENLLVKLTTEVARHVYEIFLPHNQRWHEYLPHVQFILQNKELLRDAEITESLSQRAGQCLYNTGRYKEAEIYFQEVFERRTTRFKRNNTWLLSSMIWLAATYWSLERRKEARELSDRVMEIREIMVGPGHPELLTGMVNLASVHRNQGRWKEAEELEIQVLDTRKTILGTEHPDTLTSIANLASIYQDQGRLQEAEKLELVVLEKRRIVSGDDHPDTLTSMANLASIYQEQGKPMEAEVLEMQVSKTMERLLGPEHPDTMTSMHNLALTYWNQGRLKDAQRLYTQVLDTQKQMLGPEHPSTLTSMASLASIYQDQGQLKEAEMLEKKVLETQEKVLGLRHPDTLISMHNLALIYWNQRRLKEAEMLEMQALETQKQMLGPEHPSTLTSMAHLASIYQDQGQLKEAERLEMQILEVWEKSVGPLHPQTLASMYNLAYTWKQQGKIQDALGLMEKCVEGRNKMLDSDHPDAIASSNTLDNWKAAANYSPESQTQQKPAETSPSLPMHTLPAGQTELDAWPVTGRKRRAFMRLFRR